MNTKPSFSENYVPREQGRVYARYYEGAGPAFVLMHGFPDNLHIYDDLIPYLVAGGRRVVAFDFLGFGASDKPSGATYGFKQQLGDFEVIVEVLGLGKIVPVGHDASGPAAINFRNRAPGPRGLPVHSQYFLCRSARDADPGVNRTIRDPEP